MLPTLRKQMSWSGTYKDVAFKIVVWSYESAPEKLDKWNYYIYLRESATANFNSIWLIDQKHKVSESSPERISHDYYGSPLASVDMHGGITYYDKHGYTEGHRIVEIGCDYMHLDDDQTTWSAGLLLHDTMKTIDDLYDRGILKPQVVKQLVNDSEVKKLSE